MLQRMEVCGLVFVKFILFRSGTNIEAENELTDLVTGASLLRAGSLQLLGMTIPLRFCLLTSYSKDCCG